VRPPWYRTPWALATFALTILAAAVAVYRARVAYLLGLERQRSRIAMDLHDELGSGLGSIGIISGLLAADRAAPDERRRLASEIARTAGELGAALGDIVWSLAQRPGTLKDLAARLAEQGRRLFAHDSARFEARLGPDLPETPLSLMLRRAVLLIGAEALHNAARHAEARRVLLTVDRDGAAWRLAVEDDGRGMPADRAAASGLGLENMRRRAAAIGAPLAIEPRPGGGTRVQVRFGLEGRRSPRHMFMRVS
jgi:signal transduction histidine kinase